MPVYEYYCDNESCTNEAKMVEIVKPIAKHDIKEKCEVCESVMNKYIGGSLAINIDTKSSDFVTKGSNRTKISDDTKITYEYKCVNKKCKSREEVIDIRKPVKDVDKDEKCETCQEKMNRVFSFGGFMWGKDTRRPNSDARKDDMIAAVDRGDMDTVARLNKM